MNKIKYTKHIVTLTSEQVKLAINFSNSISTNFYANRNQFDDNKRRQDQLVGKLGELAAHRYLKVNHKNVSDPDFNIYSAKKKNWSADLVADGFNFHVKSQSLDQSKIFQISWTFQFKQGTDKEIFETKNENDFVIFCVVDLDKNQVTIYSCVAVDFLHKNNLFEEPIKNSLKNIKKCVYLKSLRATKENLWQR